MATAPPQDPYEPLYPENVAFNGRQLYYIKSTSLSISGSLSGILGLTNFTGFILYFLTTFFVNFLILTVNCRFNAKSFFKTGFVEVMFGGLLDNLFNFMLWWTLFYALVHVYD